MNTFYTIFGVLSMICSVFLTFIILIQNSKGGGLSSTFGASNINALIGSRRAAQDVEKFTWYLGFGLFAIAFLANISLSNTQAKEEGFSEITVAGPGSSGLTTSPTQTAPADGGESDPNE